MTDNVSLDFLGFLKLSFIVIFQRINDELLCLMMSVRVRKFCIIFSIRILPISKFVFHEHPKNTQVDEFDGILSSLIGSGYKA